MALLAVALGWSAACLGLGLRLGAGSWLGLGLGLGLAVDSGWSAACCPVLAERSLGRGLRVIRMGAPWMRSLRRASRKLLQPASTYRERKAFVRKVGDREI